MAQCGRSHQFVFVLCDLFRPFIGAAGETQNKDSSSIILALEAIIAKQSKILTAIGSNVPLDLGLIHSLCSAVLVSNFCKFPSMSKLAQWFKSRLNR